MAVDITHSLPSPTMCLFMLVAQRGELTSLSSSGGSTAGVTSALKVSLITLIVTTFVLLAATAPTRIIAAKLLRMCRRSLKDLSNESIKQTHELLHSTFGMYESYHI